MHQNGLGCALVALVLMPLMSICARKMATCVTEAPTLGAVELGGRLGPSAFWGSWCSLGQMLGMPRVDGQGTKAKLCIYLKELQADYRLSSSPAATSGEPSDGSKLRVKIAPVVPTVSAGAAVLMTGLLEDAECAFRPSSVWEVAIVGEGEEQK